MGRIILSRELSFYHSISGIKVYVDGDLACKLSREGDVQEYPIQKDSVEVSVKEWGFKTKPVTVRDGQSVLISPNKSLIFLYYGFAVAFFIAFWYLSDRYPWPADQWDSPWHFWYRLAKQVVLLIPIFGNSFLPLFKLEVMDDLPSGYLPDHN